MVYTGQSLKRFEDPRLLRGEGAFVDDMKLPGMLHACFLRSPHAHANILAVDASAARSIPGVVAVLTGQDIAGKVKDVPSRYMRELEGVNVPEHPALARDKVCYVGQPVAVAVAQDPYVAKDALESIRVSYEVLPPLLDPREAAEEGSAPIHESLAATWSCECGPEGETWQLPLPRPTASSGGVTTYPEYRQRPWKAGPRWSSTSLRKTS